MSIDRVQSAQPPDPYTPNIGAVVPASPARIPPDFAREHPSTGTEDDDDEPEDEHPGENEASERETDERTEAPEEFEYDDEDQGAGKAAGT